MPHVTILLVWIHIKADVSLNKFYFNIEKMKQVLKNIMITIQAQSNDILANTATYYNLSQRLVL
jgi:hypothetical protein